MHVFSYEIRISSAKPKLWKYIFYHSVDVQEIFPRWSYPYEFSSFLDNIHIEVSQFSCNGQIPSVRNSLFIASSQLLKTANSRVTISTITSNNGGYSHRLYNVGLIISQPNQVKLFQYTIPEIVFDSTNPYFMYGHEISLQQLNIGNLRQHVVF